MNQKGLTPILILIGVLIMTVMVYGAYYLGTNKNSKPEQTTKNIEQTSIKSGQDETTNWKTYTLGNYGLSFKYPQDWQIMDITKEPLGRACNPPKNGSCHVPLIQNYQESRNLFERKVESVVTILPPGVITKFKPVIPKKGPGDFYISGIRLEVSRESADGFKKYLEEVQTNNNMFLSDQTAKVDRTEKNINGLTVTVFYLTHRIFDGPLLNFTEALFYKEGFIYKLSNDLPGLGEGNDNFDQILSTFKFVP